METLDVGRSGDGAFIGFPEAAYDRAIKPLSGSTVHCCLLSRDDVEWLIGALQEELDNWEVDKFVDGADP